MGKLVYSMITSLDGYVADPAGEFASWAMPDEEVLAAVNVQSERVGTYLYGRRMYEMMAVWETDPAVAAQSPQSQDFARLWQSADKIVYSTTLTEVPTQRTRLEHSFEPGAVQALKNATEADLTVDGPTLAAHALGHHLVDEIAMIICPVTIGGGLAFLPQQRMDLRLLEEQRFGNGMVQLRYAVADRS